MAKISLIRADFRLIHGQVITKWVKQTAANKIVIINDALAHDEFLASIYIMAAPPGIEVMIYSVDQAIAAWNENQMGDGNLFVLFKSIEEVYRAFKGGFPVDSLQIGGLGAGPGRIVVFGPITLDNKDAKMLKEMQDQNSHIYLHQVPDEPSMDFSKVLSKFNFDVK